MNYNDILRECEKKLDESIKWWTRYLYHFTDVHNASRILYDGFIWSREQAEKKKLMMSDNASHAVIEVTDQDNKCYGRLYFRPLTPTQYHNEGYKPRIIRKSDVDASCPVPVFFCLDANMILSLEGTCFAEKGIAGHRHNIKSGIKEFKKLNFDKIYHDGSYSDEDSDIKEYRLSEVVHEKGFPLEPFLKGILCRSNAERETLLFLIKQHSARLYNTYKEKVIFNPKWRCFYNNGIFIKEVNVINNELKVEFNDSKYRYKAGEQVDIAIKIELIYKEKNGSVLYTLTGGGMLDYSNVKSCKMKIKSVQRASIIKVKVLIDECSMYENEISLENVGMM